MLVWLQAPLHLAQGLVVRRSNVIVFVGLVGWFGFYALFGFVLFWFWRKCLSHINIRKFRYVLV